jgi:hypothetical protein
MVSFSISFFYWEDLFLDTYGVNSSSDSFSFFYFPFLFLFACLVVCGGWMDVRDKWKSRVK